MTDTDVSGPVRERLARALCRRDCPIPCDEGPCWLSISPEPVAKRKFGDHIATIDAILAELQEPSGPMIAAAQAKGIEATVTETGLPILAENSGVSWRTMMQHIRDGGS